MELAQIEKAIAARRFDLALAEVSALSAEAGPAMQAGTPEALLRLRQMLLDISRLLLLARTERAHMAAELRTLAGSASYGPAAKSVSTWHVEG